jgi:hypothetical protein
MFWCAVDADTFCLIDAAYLIEKLSQFEENNLLPFVDLAELKGRSFEVYVGDVLLYFLMVDFSFFAMVGADAELEKVTV